MKAGVSGSGEKCSAIAEDDLNARYGRFHTMKLRPSLATEKRLDKNRLTRYC